MSVAFTFLADRYMAILEGSIAFFLAGLSIFLEGVSRFEEAVRKVGEHRFKQFMVEYKEAEIKYERDPDRVKKLNQLYIDKFPSTEEPRSLLRTTEISSLVTMAMFGAVIFIDAFTPESNYALQQVNNGYEVLLFLFGSLALLLTFFGLYRLYQIRGQAIAIKEAEAEERKFKPHVMAGEK